MSKADVLKRYPDFPSHLVLEYSELAALPTIGNSLWPNDDLKVIEKTDKGEIHLVISKTPLWPSLPWCNTIYEVAAVLMLDGKQDYEAGDALGYLVYYTVDSKTDEITE